MASNSSLLLRYGFVEAGHSQDDAVRVFVPWEQNSSEGKRNKQLELMDVRALVYVRCVKLENCTADPPKSLPKPGMCAEDGVQTSWWSCGQLLACCAR